MEEGELTDSDNDQSQGAAAVSVIVTKPDQTVQSLMPNHQAGLLKTSSFRKSDVPGLSSESSSDDSDTECAAMLGKKKKKHGMVPTPRATGSVFINPLLAKESQPMAINQADRAPRDSGNSMDLDGTGASADHNPRKKNMWGSVIQEQFLEREINKFGVDPADLSVLDYRDVEAYQVPQRSQLTYHADDPFDVTEEAEEETSTFNHGARESKMDEMDEGQEDENEAKEQEGLFEMETFGTDKKKNLPKLNIQDRLGKSAGADCEPDEDLSYYFQRRPPRKQQNVDFSKELERYQLKRKRHDEKPKKKNIKERLGQKKSGDRPQQDYITITVDDPKEKVINALICNLNEPKVALMSDAYDLFGAKKMITLMQETMDIESTGGLMTNDGSRRRTPGGVFFFLLRNDRHIRRDELDQLFKVDRDRETKHKRKILAAKRANPTLQRPQDAYIHKRAKKKSSKSAQNQQQTDDKNSLPAMADIEEGEVESDSNDVGPEPDLEVELD